MPEVDVAGPTEGSETKSHAACDQARFPEDGEHLSLTLAFYLRHGDECGRGGWLLVDAASTFEKASATNVIQQHKRTT